MKGLLFTLFLLLVITVSHSQNVDEIVFSEYCYHNTESLDDVCCELNVVVTFDFDSITILGLGVSYLFDSINIRLVEYMSALVYIGEISMDEREYRVFIPSTLMGMTITDTVTNEKYILSIPRTINREPITYPIKH